MPNFNDYTQSEIEKWEEKTFVLLCLSNRYDDEITIDFMFKCHKKWNKEKKHHKNVCLKRDHEAKNQSNSMWISNGV